MINKVIQKGFCVKLCSSETCQSQIQNGGEPEIKVKHV